MTKYFNKDHEKIDARITEIKMRTVVTPKYKKILALFNKRKKDGVDGFVSASEVELTYHALRETVVQVVKDDLLWLIKWGSGLEWIDEVFYVACDFLKRGMEALPEKYKAAIGQGAFFKWSENANTTLIMMPRGIGKSYNFLGYQAAQLIIEDPNSKWLLPHGDEIRSQKNLSMINSILTNPFLALILPDLFKTTEKAMRDAGSRVTRKAINVAIDDMFGETIINGRPEATFTCCSPGVNTIGYHVDGFLGDDLVDDKNSKNPEETKKLHDYYKKLCALKQRNKKFRRFLAGTEYYKGSLYDILKEGNIICFEMPVEWQYKGETQRLHKFYTDESLAEDKEDLRDDFASQMLMCPKDPVSEINLIDNKSFVFAFADDPNPPEGVRVISQTRREILRKGGAVTSFDPSYSMNGKSWYDDSSRATIASGTIYNNSLYVYDSWQELGGSMRELYSALREQVVKNNSDLVVVDSQSYQMSMSEEYHSRLNKDPECSMTHFYYHKKASTKGARGKAERAMMFLSDLFRENLIHVHFSQQRLIDEIMRQLPSYDFLDCLIQIKTNINFELASTLFEDREVITNFDFGKKNNRRRPTFRTTGY